MNIGKVKLRNSLILAPMAGVTDLPFRLIAVEKGCGLVVSEMVSAKGLVLGGEKTRRLLETSPLERPLSVQLFGSEPDVMAEAAMILEDGGADMVDINMGCPVKKVVKDGAGSAILKDLRGAAGIIAATRKRLTIPLTVKIRTGWDTSTIVASDMLKIAEDNGADALAIHARTRSQGFSGKADWSLIAKLKEKASIPIIGNGDVKSPEDVKGMMAATGCDFVMIGRGAMGNPWIFDQALSYLECGDYELPLPEEKKQTLLKHLNLVLEIYGEVKGVRLFRKHLAWYTKGIRGSSSFRRDINGAAASEGVKGLIEGFFSSDDRGSGLAEGGRGGAEAEHYCTDMI